MSGTLSDITCAKRKRAFDIPDDCRSGDCFVVALENLMADQDLYLCHGIVHGQGSLLGIVYPHAWNETDDGYVIDMSNGNDIYMPKDEYYAIGKIDSSDVYRYDFYEAAQKVVDIGTYGPWEPVLNFEYREAGIMNSSRQSNRAQKMAWTQSVSDDGDFAVGDVYNFGDLYFEITEIQGNDLFLECFEGDDPDFPVWVESRELRQDLKDNGMWFEWENGVCSSRKTAASTYELARCLFKSLIRMDYPYTEYAVQVDGYTDHMLNATSDDEAIALFLDECPDANVYDEPKDITHKWASRTAAMYADTFEYGFIDANGDFRGGEVHIDNEAGYWICEIYGINGDDFIGFGSGDTYRDAVKNAIDDTGLPLEESEYTDLVEHIEFMMDEQRWLRSGEDDFIDDMWAYASRKSSSQRKHSSDGWDREICENLLDVLDSCAELAYEVQNSRRGAYCYQAGDTYGSLGAYAYSLGESLMDAGSYLEDEYGDLTADEIEDM